MRHPRVLSLALLSLALLACDGGDDSASQGEAPVASIRASLHEPIDSLILLEWEQLGPASTWVEFSADGETWLQSPARELEAGSQEQLLLGVPYDSQASYRLVCDQGEGPLESALGSIATGQQPEGVPTLQVLSSRREAWDPELDYVLASIDVQNEAGVSVGTYSFIFDRGGRVVWAWETPALRATIHPRVASDGASFLIDYGSYWAIFDGGAASQVARITIDGTELARYDTPGMHHPFTDMADGSIVWTATDDDDMDTLMRLNPEGETETIWGCNKLHEELGIQTYCASNTVAWNEPDDSFLVSFYSTNTVVQVDRAGGEPIRWFGQLPGGWSFDPEDSTFWWQHGVHFTEAGTLLVSAKETSMGTETVVREYELDQESQSLVQIWTFGDGQGVYGAEMGEAHRLSGGNTLHNYGSGARVREITAGGEVVWDLDFSSGTYLGRTTPIADLYDFLP